MAASATISAAPPPPPPPQQHQHQQQQQPPPISFLRTQSTFEPTMAVPCHHPSRTPTSSGNKTPLGRGYQSRRLLSCQPNPRRAHHRQHLYSNLSTQVSTERPHHR